VVPEVPFKRLTYSEILEELEQAIMANKEDFEEIITLLKERI